MTERGHLLASIAMAVEKLTVQHAMDVGELKRHQEICQDSNNENNPTFEIYLHGHNQSNLLKLRENFRLE